MDLVIASRQSDLARLQSYQVGDRLAALGHRVTHHFRQSLGDINQRDPLWQMPEKGVFSEDFRQGLIQGEWDMVVHSWKDLPIEPRSQTELVATLPRADARDVFVFKKAHLHTLKKTGLVRLFSSSPRRIYNLSPFLKKSLPATVQNVKFVSVRGNILTRIRQLMQSDAVHGLIVAKAALDRLLTATRDEFKSGQDELKDYLSRCLLQVLPLSENPTAAAQGALAIEIKKDREDLKAELAKIHCSRSWSQANAERKILKGHGGGCHQKIGVTRVDGDFGQWTFLRGETESGDPLRQTSVSQEIPPLQKPFIPKLELFSREPVAFHKPTRSDAHFVARSLALPESYTVPENHILWASGVKTWFQLAARGYWVHGCSDSLGEDLQGPGPLFGIRRWAKWTHSQGLVGQDQEAVRTYRLLAKMRGDQPHHDLSQFNEFYWMSGSQFARALELFPTIGGRCHFCGPGHTYTRIQQLFKSRGIQNQAIALPNRQTWLELIKE